jgi:hypothetical protein
MPKAVVKKIVKCRRGLLGRFWRHSLGMPSKPQAFPNFNGCIPSEMSQGQKLYGVSSSMVLSWAST